MNNAPPELYRSAPTPLQPVITTALELDALSRHLATLPAIALDTEFLRERTYRAQLCLVQIADGQRELCVDPLALADLNPLADVLGRALPTKVMHASRQDLEVLYPAVGSVANVFDTQIAAGLAGFPAQIGYADLVMRLLGQALAKGQTRTDWSRRPLSQEQLQYALEDVRYLLPLKEHLEGELARLGRSQWLVEELAELSDARNFIVDPERAWLRIKGLRGLDEGRTRLAQQLAAWREQRASERDRPRGWILDDALLREIVQRVPRTPAQLAAIPQIPEGLVKHCGPDILTRIHAADVAEPPPPLPLRPKPDAALMAVLKKLSATHQAIAAELRVSPEVLATRRDLEDLAAGRRDIALLGGWRRAVIGERLLALL